MNVSLIPIPWPKVISMPEKLTHEELEKRIQELKKSEYKRRQIYLELQRRHKFERLVSEISSEFARIDSGSIDQVIDRALSSIGAFTKADRAYIFQFKEGSRRMKNTHEWCAEGIEPQIENLKNISIDEELPWFEECIRRRDVFHVPDVTALPPEGWLEREHFEAQNIRSLFVVPMETKEKILGFLGFDSIRERRTWNDDDKSLLRFFGQTLSHVIERKRVEDALKEANTILNRSPVVAFTWKNQEGWPVEFVTENVERLFGHTAEEFFSGKVSYEDCVHKDDLKRVADEVITFSNQKSTMEYNHIHYRIVTKYGDIKIVSDWTYIIRDEEGYVTHYKGIIEDITKRKQAEEALQRERDKLEKALKQVRTLSGMLPICSSCKKIRDDKGYWNQIEAYIQKHSHAEFSHGICPECAKKLYPDLYPHRSKQP